MEVNNADEKVEVIAEPYGSASLNKATKMVSLGFTDEVPWEVIVKVMKNLKRVVNRESRNVDYFDSD